MCLCLMDDQKRSIDRQKNEGGPNLGPPAMQQVVEGLEVEAEFHAFRPRRHEMRSCEARQEVIQRYFVS